MKHILNPNSDSGVKIWFGPMLGYAVLFFFWFIQLATFLKSFHRNTFHSLLLKPEVWVDVYLALGWRIWGQIWNGLQQTGHLDFFSKNAFKYCILLNAMSVFVSTLNDVSTYRLGNLIPFSYVPDLGKKKMISKNICHVYAVA